MAFTKNAEDRIIRTVRRDESGANQRPPGSGSRRGGGDEPILARATGTYLAGEVGTFCIQANDGDKGDEADFADETELAYVRRGICFVNRLYLLQDICGGNDTSLDVVDPDQEVIGVSDAAISKGSGGTVSVYFAINGNPATDLGINISDCLARYGDVGSGKKVRCRWVDGAAWEIVNAEC